MSYEQLEIILKAIAVLISLVITLIIKPLIDSKISITRQEELKKYIEVAVRCAEQIYTRDEWAEKKQYVLNFVTELLQTHINLELTPEEVNTLIEGIVFEVKRW